MVYDNDACRKGVIPQPSLGNTETSSIRHIGGDGTPLPSVDAGEVVHEDE